METVCLKKTGIPPEEEENQHTSHMQVCVCVGGICAVLCVCVCCVCVCVCVLCVCVCAVSVCVCVCANYQLEDHHRSYLHYSGRSIVGAFVSAWPH